MSSCDEALAALDDLRVFVESTPRTRGIFEADWTKTRPLIRLELAWGYARLGSSGAAHELAREALAELGDGDPLQRFVGDLYRLRLDEAGRAAAPTGVVTAEAFGRDDRYALLQLVQHSFVLAPQRALDAFQVFQADTGLTPAGDASLLTREAGSVSSIDALVQRLSVLLSPRVVRRGETQALFLAAQQFGLLGALEVVGVVKTHWPRVTDMHQRPQWSVVRVALIDGCVFAIAQAVNPLDTAAR
jgi:hypothetical protein